MPRDKRHFPAMTDPHREPPIVSASRTPLDGLREAVLAAAAGLAGGEDGREPAGVTLERPPEGELRRLLDQRCAAAGSEAGRPAARRG